MPQMSDSFSSNRLEALRLLVRLAVVEIDEAGKSRKHHYTSLMPKDRTSSLSKDDVGKFARGTNSLGFKTGGPHGEKIKELYQLVYDFYTRRENNKLREVASLLFNVTYDKQAGSGAEGTGMWGVLTGDPTDRSSAESGRAGPFLAGCYRTYRRGTHFEPDGGEIVSSPMIIRPPSGSGGAFTFELLYQPRDPAYVPEECGIVGTVTFSTAFTYLTGYDRGSGSPYLLMIDTPRARIGGHHGLSLRSTTDGTAVATRVYMASAVEEWDELKVQSEIYAVAAFKDDKSVKDRDKILAFTDNQIDNSKHFVLKRYERPLTKPKS